MPVLDDAWGPGGYSLHTVVREYGDDPAPGIAMGSLRVTVTDGDGGTGAAIAAAAWCRKGITL